MVYEDASVASVQLLKFALLSFISHKTIAVCSCLVSLLITTGTSQENFTLFSLKNSSWNKDRHVIIQMYCLFFGFGTV